VRLVQERYANEGGGDLEAGFKGVKGFGVKEVQGCPAREDVKAKKRPEGDCPSGLKTNRRFANDS
jgi:hypothetical protein